jgi:hypothetical protein
MMFVGRVSQLFCRCPSSEFRTAVKASFFYLIVTHSCDAWILEDEDSDTWRRVFEGMLLNARNDGIDDDKAIESLQAQVGEDAYRQDL